MVVGLVLVKRSAKVFWFHTKIDKLWYTFPASKGEYGLQPLHCPSPGSKPSFKFSSSSVRDNYPQLQHTPQLQPLPLLSVCRVLSSNSKAGHCNRCADYLTRRGVLGHIIREKRELTREYKSLDSFNEQLRCALKVKADKLEQVLAPAP